MLFQNLYKRDKVTPLESILVEIYEKKKENTSPIFLNFGDWSTHMKISYKHTHTHTHTHAHTPSGLLLDVATTTTPLSNRAVKSLFRIMASAISVT